LRSGMTLAGVIIAAYITCPDKNTDPTKYAMFIGLTIYVCLTQITPLLFKWHHSIWVIKWEHDSSSGKVCCLSAHNMELLAKFLYGLCLLENMEHLEAIDRCYWLHSN